MGETMLSSLIHPLPLEEFLRIYWGKLPKLVKRGINADYYQTLFSFSIEQMLYDHDIPFAKNFEIFSYNNGQQVKRNPVGRALPPAVYDFYSQGCSVRFINPDIYEPTLHEMIDKLQEYFHCRVEINAHLVPRNSQGCAPRSDNFEMFVLQIKGRKRWRLSKPRDSARVLPNFTRNDNMVLKAGDMLYIPRGTIYQASTESNCHSQHFTLYVHRQSYADLFKQMIPLMPSCANTSDLEPSRGLPLHIWRNAGIAFNNINTQERSDMLQEVKRLFEQVLRSESIADLMDAAVDQLAKKYQREARPPQVLITEEPYTVFGTHSQIANGQIMYDYKITGRTYVRLLRANIMRLVKEESWRIYYYMENKYWKNQQNYIEIGSDLACLVVELIRSYPEYIGVFQLPLLSEKRKVELVSVLFQRGLLMVNEPFNTRV